MPALDVTFDIPARILEGLMNGTLVRNGGVIQDNAGRVVMWLKETGTTPIVSDQLKNILALTTAGSSILTLGVSVLGFAVIYKQTKVLEGRLKKVQEILEKVDEKIDLSFYANFRAALDLAQNAFHMSDQSNRHNSAHQAINRFLEAEHVYADLADKELERRSQIGDEYLLTLCLAYIAETRCYLELGEYDTAIRRFQEGQVQVQERIAKYIDILLTSNPLMYLHPELKESVDLSRLTKIYQWKDPELTENTVFEQLRHGLPTIDLEFNNWVKSLPASVIEQTDVKKGFFGVSDEGRKSIFERLPLVVEEMESMIETNQRFASYEYEIKLLNKANVSLRKWESLKPAQAVPEGASLICICPPKALAL